MLSSPQSKWMAFLDDNLLDDPPQPNSLFWCSVNEQADLSVDNRCCRADQQKAISKKSVGGNSGAYSLRVFAARLGDEPTRQTPSKACREKLRRDRLNDRFLELSTLLDSGRPPKTDKIVILAGALTTLNQLRTEAQQLSNSNEKLRETIKELKVEKNELRDEKQVLKSEKERLEQQLKAMAMSGGFRPHPTMLHAAMAAFSAQNPGSKVSPPALSFAGLVGGMGMWPWMPPAALDTSQDHMLRPPVA